MKGFISEIDFTASIGQSRVVVSPLDRNTPLPIGYEGVVKMHGILMLFAWGVLPFIAIYITRYMKHLGHRRHLMHIGIMLTTILLTLIAFFIIVLNKPTPHFNEPHTVFSFLTKGCWSINGDWTYISSRPWFLCECPIRS
jgi:hypothetical protein